MKKIFSFLLSLIICTATLAAGNGKAGKLAFNGYSGGMMLHTGYVYGGNITLTDRGSNVLPNEKMSGMPTGIGGAIKLQFGKGLRIGTEGYVTSLSYGKYASNIRTGWGGLLADYIWHRGKFSPFIGATIGGGSVRNLTLTEKTPLDTVVENNASYRRYSFACAVPFAGIEYSMTQRIRIVLKVDYIFNVSNPQPDFVTGPRVYLGFMFSHMKK